MFKRLATMSAALMSLSVLLLSCGSYYEGKSVALKSPDGKVEAVFELKELPEPYHIGENMYFTVSYAGLRTDDLIFPDR